MISNGVIVQSSQLSRLGITQQVLNEGSTVRVKIIADKGNGKYTGSVAGVRVNISSSKSLSVGSSFLATISTKNGIIYIAPKNESLVLNNNITLAAANNSEIAGLLEAMGLPADQLYLNLVQQFKQLEMKLDVQLMSKLHNLALKFKGKEKRALSLLTAFTNKKINLSEKELLALLQYLSEYEDGNEVDYSENKNQDKLNKLNQIEDGWFILPFELYNLNEDVVTGNGTIRLLFNKLKNLEILNLNCNYREKKYLFSVKFENKSCKRIRFNISPLKESNISSQIELLKKKFYESGYNIEIEWADEELIEGDASGLEKIYGIGGLI